MALRARGNHVGVISAAGNAEVRVGDVMNQQITFKFGSSGTDSKQKLDVDRYLKVLRISDPADEKEYIQQIKGGLVRESYEWILLHPDFRKWQVGQGSSFLHIKGNAGKGKTMLLCGIVDTICSTPVQEQDIPIVLFVCCDGARHKFNQATLVLRGIIYRLLCQRPLLASHMQQRYERTNGRFLDDEDTFHVLSQILIAMLRDTSDPQQYMVVIDALDECESELGRLLGFLAHGLSKLENVKCLVSSRYNYLVEQYLHSASIISLESNGSHTVSAIRAFINNRTEHLLQFREDSDLRSKARSILEKNAAGTFLWVALVIQELLAVQGVDILDRLNSIPQELFPYYQRMLRQLEAHSLADFKRCQALIATVAVAKQALSLQQLIVLANIPGYSTASLKQTQRIVDLCSSFLTVHDNFVSIIHESAREFLLTEGLPTIFPMGLANMHDFVFQQSLRIMSENLRRNMFKLTEPDATPNQLNKAEASMLDLVAYPCTHWVDHLCNGPLSDGLVTQYDYMRPLYDFLSKRLLFWIEALTLLGSMAECVAAIKKLDSATKTTPHSRLSALIYDTRRFIGAHRFVIENTPLQLYSSALLFSPRNSTIWQLYQHMAPNWITIRHPRDFSWDNCLEIISQDVQCFAFLQSPSLLAIGKRGSYSSSIEIRTSLSGSCIKTIESQASIRTVLRFSGDGRLLAAGLVNGLVEIWDIPSGNLIQLLRGHDRPIISLSFSINCKLLISTCEGGCITVWGVQLGSITWQKTFPYASHLSAAAFGVEDECILLWSDDHLIRLYDTYSGEPVRTTRSHITGSALGTFSPDGQVLAVSKTTRGSRNDYITVLDTKTGSDLFSFRATGQATSIAYSTDGQQVVVTTTTGMVHQFGRPHSIYLTSLRIFIDRYDRELASICLLLLLPIDLLRVENRAYEWIGHVVAPLLSKVAIVNFLTMMDPLRYISVAMILLVAYAALWKPTKAPVSSSLTPARDIHSTAFSQEGILTLGNDGELGLWETPKKVVESGNCHTVRISMIQFSTDGSRIASCSEDGTIKVWDNSSGLCIRTLNQNKGTTVLERILSGVVFAGFAFIAAHTGGGDNNDWEPFKAAASRAVFSADNARLTASYSDGTIMVWDLRTGKIEYSIYTNSDCTPLFAMSTTTQWLCCGDANKVLAWKIENRRKSLDFEVTMKSEVVSVALSNDDQLLAAQDSSGLITIWNTASRKLLAQYGQETVAENMLSKPRAFSLSFSATGKYIVSTTGGRQLRIFHTLTGKQASSTFSDHFSPNGVQVHLRSNNTLLTPRGRLDLAGEGSCSPTGLSVPLDVRYRGYGVDVDGDWITKDGERILRLPPRFARGAFAVNASTISFASKSGHSFIIAFTGNPHVG